MAVPGNSPPSRRRGAQPSAAIDAALKEFFVPRLAGGARVCVGLSGGMDSVVLLHALCRLAQAAELPVAVSAVHVHHGISPRADDWAEFCRALCLRLDVPLDIVPVMVPRNSGEGLEGAARRLRHEAFAAIDADWLALGHHRDDQAETVLLNLLRGAGVAGAAGMLVERGQTRGPALVRPFLGVPRVEIAQYAHAHQLAWVEDESNDDRHFRRNFLRHDVMPALERSFPGAGASLARAAGHFAEASALLDDLAAMDLQSVAGASGRVAIDSFNRLPSPRARNLLRYVWSRAGFRAPDARWIGEALKQLATADALSELCLATSDGELHVYRGELYPVPLRAAPPPTPLACSGQEALLWAGGLVRFEDVVGRGIRRAAIVGKTALLATRQGGERLQPDGRRPRRSLRNLLQENAVPPWERERLPLLWIDGRLAWIGGIGCDAAFACPAGEAGILPVWEGAHSATALQRTS